MKLLLTISSSMDTSNIILILEEWCGGRDLNSRFVHGLIKQPQCITTEPGPQPGAFDLAWQPPQSAQPNLMALAKPSRSDYSHPLRVKQIHFVSLFIFSGAIFKISFTKTRNFGHREEISISLLCSVSTTGITTWSRQHTTQMEVARASVSYFSFRL